MIFNITKQMQDLASGIGCIDHMDMGKYYLPNSYHSLIEGEMPDGMEFSLELIIREPKSDAQE